MSGFTNNPNGITSFGVPVIGSGPQIPVTTGNYYFVDSGNVNANVGTFQQPFSTIDQAINACVANRGDVVIVGPGHAETISGATSLAMDKAGVHVIGLGNGSLRPTLTYSATASIINVTAADCVMENLLIVGNVDNIVTGIALSAAADGFTLRNVEFRDGASDKEFLILMTIAALCSDVTIDGLVFHGLGGGMTDCIVAAGAADRFKIVNSYIRCDASDKIIDLSAAASVGVIIQGNLFINIDVTAGLGVVLNASTTGFVADNRAANLKDTVVWVSGAGMAYAENYGSNALNASGIILPAVDS
jgi:hypothetical protein